MFKFEVLYPTFDFGLETNRFVFDLEGKTDIFMISLYSTYALAIADLVGKRRQFVQITADETNDGLTTLYWWDGTTLNWVVTQEV